MRPSLVFVAIVLLAVAAFGQQPFPLNGLCFYGCGPFVPRLTTPEISFQQVSPNPVGASNATTGLIAGATNSTLSQIQGSTSSVYTVPVWYQGGAPLITPEVNLFPEPIERDRHPLHGGMHEMMMHEQMMHEQMSHEMRPHEGGAHEGRFHEGHPQQESRAPEALGSWTYFVGPEPTAEASAARGVRKAARTYGNDDVTRQNDKNGNVKYDGKTEKM